MPDNDYVGILDFGSQYTQLIARRTREASVYCEILPPDVSPDALKKHRLKGVILSGGPASVYQRRAPTCDPKIFELGVPVLGICYGLQLGAKLLGAKVSAASDREYGRTDLTVKNGDKLFRGVPNDTQVWMSHGDKVEATTKEFEVLASSKNCAWAAVRHKKRAFYGVQFHPEVQHTPYGTQIIRNFLYAICGCRGDWEMKSYVDNAIAEIRRTAGKDHILCALSGGVDSGVVAALVHKAVSSRLTCVFVDNGLLRKGEAKKVRDFFEKRMHVNLVVVDAANKFLNKLKGVTDPEKKRTIIGHTFIDVFKTAARPLKQVKFLAQGTLYPDVIESRSATGSGPSAKIKTHHNVGGLPEELGFRLIEPLKTLFKDEARRIGRELGLPEELVRRQPFPGPGLAVRCPGLLTPERLEILREADEVVTQEIEKAKLQEKLWQYFAVLLPVKSVGVMGDERTFQEVVSVRIVESLDGMTADWARIPYDVLGSISSRIVNEVKGVNRVVYDISSKPPSTIEWE